MNNNGNWSYNCINVGEDDEGCDDDKGDDNDDDKNDDDG